MGGRYESVESTFEDTVDLAGGNPIAFIVAVENLVVRSDGEAIRVP